MIIYFPFYELFELLSSKDQFFLWHTYIPASRGEKERGRNWRGDSRISSFFTTAKF